MEYDLNGKPVRKPTSDSPKIGSYGDREAFSKGAQQSGENPFKAVWSELRGAGAQSEAVNRRLQSKR